MVKSRTPYILDQHVADVYLLAKDILLNFAKQRQGYRAGFYYAFNPTIDFLQSDGSAISQLMLLEQLRDREMVSYVAINASLVPDNDRIFLSFNARRYSPDTLYDITINADQFNREYKILSKYEPSLLTKNQGGLGSSRFPTISPDGDLFIPGIGVPIHFKINSQGFILLHHLLKNKGHRMTMWNYNEIESHLDVPSHLHSSDERNQWIYDTASNVKRKIANEANIKNFIVIRHTKDKKTINLIDKFV